MGVLHVQNERIQHWKSTKEIVNQAKKCDHALFAQYITIHSLKPQFYETENVRVVTGL